jgi:hypothetical protein
MTIVDWSSSFFPRAAASQVSSSAVSLVGGGRGAQSASACAGAAVLCARPTGASAVVMEVEVSGSGTSWCSCSKVGESVFTLNCTPTAWPGAAILPDLCQCGCPKVRHFRVDAPAPRRGLPTCQVREGLFRRVVQCRELLEYVDTVRDVHTCDFLKSINPCRLRLPESPTRSSPAPRALPLLHREKIDDVDECIDALAGSTRCRVTLRPSLWHPNKTISRGVAAVAMI